MKEERYFYVPNALQVTELPDGESQHATRVLRLKVGDSLLIVDGKGKRFEAEVTMATPKHCFYQIRSQIQVEKTWQGHIHLAIAPTKMMERMEWLVEKATEIGFDEITFLDCQFSERHTLRTDRIEKIMVSAMKQSHKAHLPHINEMTSFTTFIKQQREGRKFIAHCYNDKERHDFFHTIYSANTTDDITIMIGPEGDFSIDEVIQAIDHDFTPVSLGESRLRTETAGLCAVMMSQLTLQKGHIELSDNKK